MRDNYVQIAPQEGAVLMLTDQGNFKFDPVTAMSLAAWLCKAAVSAVADSANPEDLEDLAKISEYSTQFLNMVGADAHKFERNVDQNNANRLMNGGKMASALRGIGCHESYAESLAYVAISVTPVRCTACDACIRRASRR